ncbi:MAG: glutathione peroxidase [Planctomycetota bacterium]
MSRLFPFAFLAMAIVMTAFQPAAADATSKAECALDFQAKTIDGEPVDLHDYEGSVVLIVNVASRCGLTRQYAGLQALYEKYQDQGFVVLGFPCNQFGGQEPGTEADIKQFCSTKYDVSFPMFSKIEVNGDGADDLYKNLTSQDVEPAGSGPISWNFEKFLIDRDGNLIHRFSPRTAPSDDELVSAIEAAL